MKGRECYLSSLNRFSFIMKVHNTKYYSHSFIYLILFYFFNFLYTYWDKHVDLLHHTNKAAVFLNWSEPKAPLTLQLDCKFSIYTSNFTKVCILFCSKIVSNSDSMILHHTHTHTHTPLRDEDELGNFALVKQQSLYPLKAGTNTSWTQTHIRHRLLWTRDH